MTSKQKTILLRAVQALEEDDRPILAMQVRDIANALPDEPSESQTKINNLIAALNAKQAKIDALMLEFCPGEISASQREGWAAAPASKDHVIRTLRIAGASCDGPNAFDAAADMLLGQSDEPPGHLRQGMEAVDASDLTVDAIRERAVAFNHWFRTNGGFKGYESQAIDALLDRIDALEVLPAPPPGAALKDAYALWRQSHAGWCLSGPPEFGECNCDGTSETKDAAP